jgi:hypothetical protein
MLSLMVTVTPMYERHVVCGMFIMFSSKALGNILNCAPVMNRINPLINWD